MGGGGVRTIKGAFANESHNDDDRHACGFIYWGHPIYGTYHYETLVLSMRLGYSPRPRRKAFEGSYGVTLLSFFPLPDASPRHILSAGACSRAASDGTQRVQLPNP